MGNMNEDYLGTPHFPIPPLYLHSALQILIAGWERLRGKNLLTPELAEDDITAYLSNEMKSAQRDGVSDIINWDPQVGTQTNQNNPLEVLKIDIKFRWDQYPNDNDRYLAAEAKKLRGKGTSLAGAYVEEGVMRFLTARYGRGHDYGIMIGYIIVPPVNTAVAKVGKAMTKRKTKTREQSCLTYDGLLCSNPNTYTSSHIQEGTNCCINLVHLFFDCGLPQCRNVSNT